MGIQFIPILSYEQKKSSSRASFHSLRVGSLVRWLALRIKSLMLNAYQLLLA